MPVSALVINFSHACWCVPTFRLVCPSSGYRHIHYPTSYIQFTILLLTLKFKFSSSIACDKFTQEPLFNDLDPLSRPARLMVTTHVLRRWYLRSVALTVRHSHHERRVAHGPIIGDPSSHTICLSYQRWARTWFLGIGPGTRLLLEVSRDGLNLTAVIMTYTVVKFLPLEYSPTWRGESFPRLLFSCWSDHFNASRSSSGNWVRRYELMMATSWSIPERRYGTSCGWFSCADGRGIYTSNPSRSKTRRWSWTEFAFHEFHSYMFEFDHHFESVTRFQNSSSGLYMCLPCS